MSTDEKILKALESNNALLADIKEALSSSPITSGIIDKAKAIELLGFSPSVGRQHIEYMRHRLLILSKPPGSPTKYFVSEILLIKEKLRQGQITLPSRYVKKEKV